MFEGDMLHLALPEETNWQAALFISAEGTKAVLFACQMCAQKKKKKRKPQNKIVTHRHNLCDIYLVEGLPTENVIIILAITRKTCDIDEGDILNLEMGKWKQYMTKMRHIWKSCGKRRGSVFSTSSANS